MNYALSRIGLDAEETWVIGDNPATDILAGNAAGCLSILVLTGLANESNSEQLVQAAGCRADHITDNLHTLFAYIEDKLETFT